MSKAIAVLLIIVGLINFLPVLGVLSAAKLSQAYSIELLGNDIVILMRHRALLFGVVGGFVLVSVFVPAWQWPAMGMAAISMLGFLWLAWSVGGYNESIARVALVDMAGMVCVAVAAVLKYLGSAT